MFSAGVAALAAAIVGLTPTVASADSNHNITVAPGTAVRFEGSGCPPNSQQTAGIAASHATGGVLGTFHADASGRYDVVFRVPWWGEQHAVVELCGAPWLVTYTRTPTGLPFTGFPMVVMVVIGCTLITSGVAVASVRRPARTK